MGTALGQILIFAFLLPAAVVFILAYRHAMKSWLVRPDEHLPQATVARNHHAFGRREAGRRFHAVAIASAFASVFIMSAIAAAMIITAVVAA